MKLKGLEFWCEGGLLMELTRMLPPFKNPVTIEDVVRSPDPGGDDDELLIVDISLKLLKGRKVTHHQWAHLDSVNLTEVFQDIIKGFTRIPRLFTRVRT